MTDLSLLDHHGEGIRRIPPIRICLAASDDPSILEKLDGDALISGPFLPPRTEVTPESRTPENEIDAAAAAAVRECCGDGAPERTEAALVSSSSGRGS
jgi:hypothetical protein